MELERQVVVVGLVACSSCFLFFAVACLLGYSGDRKQFDGVAGTNQSCLDVIAFALVALSFHPSRNFHYCAFGELFGNT